MLCKICNKEIERGKGYKGERFKTEHFCCEDCYNERIKQSNERKIEIAKNKYKPKKGTDRRKLTDLIQSIYGKEANFPMLMTQIKAIEQDYDITDNELRLAIKYSINYEYYLPNTNYGIYQFVSYIVPMKKFRESLKNNQETKIEEDETVIIRNSSKKRIWHER